MKAGTAARAAVTKAVVTAAIKAEETRLLPSKKKPYLKIIMQDKKCFCRNRRDLGRRFLFI